MKINKNIMVCVTKQKTCDRLIKTGDKIRTSNKDNLYIVHIINQKDKILYGNNDGEALEFLSSLARKLNAELIVKKSSNTIKAIIDLAKKLKITDIILGSPKSDNSEGIHRMIKERLDKVNIIID